VSIAPEGSSATLTQGRERLWCKILSGGGDFTVRDAAPFSTSPNPSGQNGNGFAKKLSITLTGVTTTRLTVYLKPLASGDPIPTTLPAVTSLDDWTISGIDDAPSLSEVADQTVDEDNDTGALPFFIGDDLTTAGSLTLSATSSNTTLVPDANIVFGGSGANRTVKVTPATDKIGTATITFSVSDGTNTTSDTFKVTVTGTALETWRFANFGTTANTGSAADTFDANGDGEANLLEYATAQNPSAASLVTLSAIRTANAVVITYTRSLAALTEGVTFTVEWSDTLSPHSWSTADAEQSILSDDGTLQSVEATVLTSPAIPRRFIRLKVISP
jgi:hypothetical protein